MFSKKVNKKVEKPMEIDSLIGEKIKLTGQIQGEGTLRVDGTIEGDVDYKGDVIIGESGKVDGNISCYNISIAGTVKGNVKTEKLLTLHTTARLTGDAEIATLIVHEDAIFQGCCKMLDKETEKPNLDGKKKVNAK